MLKSTGKFLYFITTSAALVCGIQGQLQCLTSTETSCSEGSLRGRPDTIETRLIFSMSFTCSGKIVGWTVSGRSADGTQYPKLQVWRADPSRGYDFYFKPGNDIQVDAQGTACDTITETCDRIFQCRLSVANQVSVEPGDILGVELPPIADTQSGFELFFIGGLPNTQDHYIFRQQLGSTVRASSRIFRHLADQLLVDLEIDTGTQPTTSIATPAITESSFTSQPHPQTESSPTLTTMMTAATMETSKPHPQTDTPPTLTTTTAAEATATMELSHTSQPHLQTETPPTLITATTVATDATTTTKELAKMESASTTERNTMIALMVGVSMGGVLVGTMISIAITVLVIVTLRVRRRNKKPGPVKQESVNTIINHIEMTENECYGTINNNHNHIYD